MCNLSSLGYTVLQPKLADIGFSFDSRKVRTLRKDLITLMVFKFPLKLVHRNRFIQILWFVKIFFSPLAIEGTVKFAAKNSEILNAIDSSLSPAMA